RLRLGSGHQLGGIPSVAELLDAFVQPIVEGENGIGAYLLGRQQHTTGGEFEAGVRTQSSKALRGPSADPDLFDLQCPPCGARQVKLTDSSRTRQNLGKRDRTCPQRIPRRLQQRGFSL